jgi:hypothetical protein
LSRVRRGRKPGRTLRRRRTGAKEKDMFTLSPATLIAAALIGAGIIVIFVINIRNELK